LLELELLLQHQQIVLQLEILVMQQELLLLLLLMQMQVGRVDMRLVCEWFRSELQCRGLEGQRGGGRRRGGRGLWDELQIDG